MNACAVCPRTFEKANARAQHERRAHPDWTAPAELAAARTKAKYERYNATHAEQRIESWRSYRARHPERARETEARYRSTHREATRAASRAWRHSPAGREAARLTRQEQIASGKHSARMAVQRAVDTGALVRGPCAVCGSPRGEAHHHLGYEREHWLHVVWLCDQHHADAHHPEAADIRRRIEQVA